MTEKDTEQMETDMPQELIDNALPNLHGMVESFQILHESGISQRNVVYDILFRAYDYAIRGFQTMEYRLNGKYPLSLENVEILKDMKIYDSTVYHDPKDYDKNSDDPETDTTSYFFSWEAKDAETNDKE
jgi:hypothetical protein